MAFPLELLADHKSCGPCTVCCIVPEIAELSKPAYTPCSHLCDKGCSVYAARPGSCREFYCVWRMSDFPGEEEYRPDRSGVFFTLVENFGEPTLSLHELRPGALDAKIHEAKRQILERLPGIKFVKIAQLNERGEREIRFEGRR